MGLRPCIVTGDAWYGSIENLKFLREQKIDWIFALKKSDSVPKGTRSKQVSEIDIPHEGCEVHLKGYGMVRVFEEILKTKSRNITPRPLPISSPKCLNIIIPDTGSLNNTTVLSNNSVTLKNVCFRDVQGQKIISFVLLEHSLSLNSKSSAKSLFLVFLSQISLQWCGKIFHPPKSTLSCKCVSPRGIIFYQLEIFAQKQHFSENWKMSTCGCSITKSKPKIAIQK